MKILLIDATTTTSTSVLTDTMDSITGSIYANQAGALHVEQSGDGTNWDIDDTIAVSASTGTKINVPILLPYARLRWVPTGTPPTTLRCFARLASSGSKES